MARNRQTVLLIGISARWLLESATRAGIDGIAIDHFADWDTSRLGSVLRYERFDQIPELIQELTGSRSFAGILLGGGFESHLELAEELGSVAKVANLTAVQARFLRDPKSWNKMFREAGIATPHFQTPGMSPNPNHRWLIKRLKSGGGFDVREWNRGECLDPGTYLQERIAGRASSALFLYSRRGCSVLGFFRQINGRAAFGTKGHQFCGAIGPLPCSDAFRDQLNRIGLAMELAVRPSGLIGVDLIERDHELVPIEINPRPTATGDLWERVNPQSLIQMHLEAFGITTASRPEVTRRSSILGEHAANRASIPGKAILYWPGEATWSVSIDQFEYLQACHEEGWMSDIPHVDTQLKRGDPMVTIYTCGTDEADCEARLLGLSSNVYCRLGLGSHNSSTVNFAPQARSQF